MNKSATLSYKTVREEEGISEGKVFDLSKTPFFSTLTLMDSLYGKYFWKKIKYTTNNF